ncbi:hypothetical protein MMC15_002597 [Xylographa vitiligo]|nr:hypothetical protein [Xylographa vitiligo]
MYNNYLLESGRGPVVPNHVWKAWDVAEKAQFDACDTSYVYRGLDNGAPDETVTENDQFPLSIGPFNIQGHSNCNYKGPDHNTAGSMTCDGSFSAKCEGYPQSENEFENSYGEQWVVVPVRFRREQELSSDMPTIEVLPNSTSISAPGWTYVPDTGYDPSKAPIQAGPRKRNARIAGTSGGDTTARQNNAILKRLADLDKDNSKDVHISVPSKQKEAGGRASKGKTAATRKILIAQKTFANYVADEEALAALEPQPVATLKARVSNMTSKRTASTLSREASSSTAPLVVGGSSFHESRSAITNSVVPLSGFARNDAPDARLLQSSVPAIPSDSLLEALVTAQPLSYNAARAAPSSSGRPQRHFCEFCGYWGQIKCIKCGARVCGLVCKKAHDEERCQKYFG